MFIAMRKRLEEREGGFTLIELLVVVIIIGILAAIAIPAFLGQRERARRGAVQSDLRNVATQAETFFTDNQTYVGFEPSGLFTNYTWSDGVVVVGDATDETATFFCIEAGHPGLPTGETWSYRNQPAAGIPQLNDIAC